MSGGGTLRLEDFIQAVQSQLDNAQAAMALKARNLNMPLTFAIKDINLDLRAHVEFADSEIRIRPAGAGEADTSLFHLVFTTITRPAIEENAVAMSTEHDDEPLDSLGDQLTSDERRRLEWAGVRTVRQFQHAAQTGAVRAIGRVTNLSVDRLHQALDRASAPQLQLVQPVAPQADAGDDAAPLLRVTGRNLAQGGRLPLVRIGDRPVAVARATPTELLLAPRHDQWQGELTVSPSADHAVALAFDLSAFAPPSPAPLPEVAAMTIAAIPPPAQPLTETRQ